MCYRFLLAWLSFTTSLFSISGVDAFVKASLESDLLPINQVDNTFNLIVNEESFLFQTTIPKDTKITCNKNKVEIFGNSSLIFASCNKIFLPSGRQFHIRGNVFSENLNAGILTNNNAIITKGSSFLIKIDRINDNSIHKDTLIKVSLEKGFSIMNESGDTFSLIVKEYIYDSAYRKILIPKGTKVTCKQENVESTAHGFIIIASCNSMIFPNGTYVNLKSELYNKDGTEKFILKHNENPLEGTVATIKITEDLDFE